LDFTIKIPYRNNLPLIDVKIIGKDSGLEAYLGFENSKTLYVMDCNFCNMKVVMDSDALIKIAKSSLKDLVVSNISVHISNGVKKESIEEGKAAGFADAILLEKNVSLGKISVVSTGKRKEVEAMIKDLELEGGEADSIRLFHQGRYDSIVSDDQKFLDLIDGIGIPFLTPTALIFYLYKIRKLALEEARKCLEKIRPMISTEEYSLTMERLK